jgi:hypothetical protein
VALDWVTYLRESMASGYTGILVIVDELTRMAMNVSGYNDIDRQAQAGMFRDHVICKHGVPDSIITDRGTQFTS